MEKTIRIRGQNYGPFHRAIQKSNCLSLIKLLAAFQVMIGHLIAHLELPFPKAVGHSRLHKEPFFSFGLQTL